jgi:hypothetical protein
VSWNELKKPYRMTPRQFAWFVTMAATAYFLIAALQST